MLKAVKMMVKNGSARRSEVMKILSKTVVGGSSFTCGVI